MTYYLVDAHVFRWRQRCEIYSFASENEMLEWLSVFNQVTCRGGRAQGSCVRSE